MILEESRMENNFVNVYQHETKRLQDLLTPLSIIMGLQLSIFFYFVDKGWVTDDFVWAPTGGLGCSLLALALVLGYGIFDPWQNKESTKKATRIKLVRSASTTLVLISMALFAIAVVTILNKIDYWVLW